MILISSQRRGKNSKDQAMLINGESMTTAKMTGRWSLAHWSGGTGGRKSTRSFDFELEKRLPTSFTKNCLFCRHSKAPLTSTKNWHSSGFRLPNPTDRTSLEFSSSCCSELSLHPSIPPYAHFESSPTEVGSRYLHVFAFWPAFQSDWFISIC